MQREQLDLDEDDGYRALQEHLVTKAELARERYGPDLDIDAFRSMLDDRDIVRRPTQLVYDSKPLLKGEFGTALPVPGSPERAYQLILHESFRGRGFDSVLLASYHVPTVNYLDIVTHEEAELFGAVLAGMTKEDYYRRICELADGMPAVP